PTHAGWNNPGFTGFNPGFNPGFNDFANVPGSNPGTTSGNTSGTPGMTPTTNTGHPGFNWTGGYATNAA
ncbi:MAG: hypothetical protein ACYTDE_10605, partial [Planctomycetota bacterium]